MNKRDWLGQTLKEGDWVISGGDEDDPGDEFMLGVISEITEASIFIDYSVVYHDGHTKYAQPVSTIIKVSEEVAKTKLIKMRLKGECH